MSKNNYGILTDYVTGEEIRSASYGEWVRSVESSENGAYTDPSLGRSVFVAGGPAS